MKKQLLIGVGNRDRGDDALGPLVAEALADLENTEVVSHYGEGASLMDLWETADRIVVVDAMRAHLPPGTLKRFDVVAEPLSSGTFHYSTHLFGLAEAVETARALDRLPPEMIVYGVEGHKFEFGAPLSPEVAAILPELVDRVRRDLSHA